jgi:hypothetical protein
MVNFWPGCTEMVPTTIPPPPGRAMFAFVWPPDAPATIADKLLTPAGTVKNCRLVPA